MQLTDSKIVLLLVCVISIITSTLMCTFVNFYLFDEESVMESWISPADHYLPLAFRVNSEGVIYYDHPYLVIRVHNKSDQWISWLAFGELFDFGVYEWKAKCENDVSRTYIYLGILEHHHGWSDEGIIVVKFDDSMRWQFYTSDETGNTEATVIDDVDFTVENTFKIDWTSSYISLYINGTLKATHTDAVPQEAMQLFAEVGTGSSAPSCEPKCFFRGGSFREIA